MPLLYLNSRDQNVVLDSNQNVQWSINDPRLQTLGSCTVSLVNLEIPNVVYPINEYYNKVKVYQDGVGSYTATVTPGFYTGSSLATALAAAMSTASGVAYTGSFSTTTYKITITRSAPNGFYWQEVSNNMYTELGVSNFGFAYEAVSQTGSYPVLLQGTNFIDLVCSELPTTNVSVGSAGQKVLARVPIDQTFGNIIFFQPSIGQAIPVSMSGLSSLTLSMYDDRGNPWILPPNAHISLCLSIEPIMDSNATSGTLANPDYSSTFGDIMEHVSYRY